MSDDRDTLRAMHIDAENLLAETREQLAQRDARIKELKEALENAAYAPEWTHELKNVESECRAVLEVE
jgi:hypothetical protein